MKMSDTICVPKSEPGFLTDCRLCLNESKFPTVSIFDEKYKNDDLARKIMLLTNIVITPISNNHHNNEPDVNCSSLTAPTSICLKCKNKVDAFLVWKETAWTLQKRFKPSKPLGSGTDRYRQTRHQFPAVRSEKLPLGHRSSNDSCIDEDYDSLLASPCSSSPDSPHPHPLPAVQSRLEDESSQDAGGSSSGDGGMDDHHHHHERHHHHHHHLLMEPVVKIEEESVEYNGGCGAVDYDGGGGDGHPDSTELAIDEADENRLRHEQNRIQHFLNRGGANSILRSLISAELPIIRPGSSEAAVLTNRTNLPISPALPPFKLDDSNKDRTSTSYRRKQKHPTRTGHESDEDGNAPRASSLCALRSLPDEVLSQKLPVPSSSSSSSSVHTSTVIVTPPTSTSYSSSSGADHIHQSHPSPPQQSSPSPKKARKSMYPFNYLLEAIDFTSRQSSPDNTSYVVVATTSDEKESCQEQQYPEPDLVEKQEVKEEDDEEEEEDHPDGQDPAVLEDIRRDLQEIQRQQQAQRDADSRIIQQHLRETIAGVASRTHDPPSSRQHDNHHDYTPRPPHVQHQQLPQQVFSIKLNTSLLSPNTHHIPSSLTNGYYPGSDLKSAAEISLKNLLASNQASAPPPNILKKARAPRSSNPVNHNHHSSPSNGNHGNNGVPSNAPLSLKMSSRSGAESHSPSPSPSPSPLPLPLTSNEAESPRSSPKIRFTSSQSPYPNLQIGQILPKRHDLACTNCNTKVTTIWRRYPSGEMVCNACGLYYRLHCRPRPVSMRRDNIHPRKRRPKNSAAAGKRLSHVLSNVDSGDKESLSSGDESSSISLNSFISSTPFHLAPHHHYAHAALNLSPLQCEDNLPLNLAATPTAELAR